MTPGQESTNSRDVRANHHSATVLATRAEFASGSHCFQNQASRTSLALLTLMWRKRQKAGADVDGASVRDPPRYNTVCWRGRLLSALSTNVQNASGPGRTCQPAPQALDGSQPELAMSSYYNRQALGDSLSSKGP